MENSTFVIEKGIPIPTKHPGNPMAFGAKWVTLIANMEVGDSVLVVKPPMSNLYGAAHRHGWKVSFRKQPEGVKTYRMWRVQ